MSRRFGWPWVLVHRAGVMQGAPAAFGRTATRIPPRPGRRWRGYSAAPVGVALHGAAPWTPVSVALRLPADRDSTLNVVASEEIHAGQAVRWFDGTHRAVRPMTAKAMW